MSEERGLQVVEQHLPEVSDGSLADALEIIEKRDKLWNQVMSVAIKATSSRDWVDMGGKPYLQGSGAEKVGRRFGVKIFDVIADREELEDENGRYYMYTVSGKVALGSSKADCIEAIGTCSSRDKFFGTVKGERKAFADVDMSNIKKKAYTNFIGNGITRLLGLRNLLWDDLRKFGITKDGKASVEYKNNKSESKPEPKQETKAEQKTEGKKDKMPFWDWNAPNGNHYLYARLGRHFTLEFLKEHGFKPTEKDEKTFWAAYSDGLMEELQVQFESVGG